MAGNKGVVFVLLLATVVLSAFVGICSAKTFVVGGKTGWTIPSTPSFYNSWVASQKIQVGDVLVFIFPPGSHTVAEVSKANYDACTSAATLGPVLTTAPANITLTKPGTHYFICTIPGHCSGNQKLTVTVAASSLVTAPTPAPKASSPTPTPATSPVTSPTPAVSGPAPSGPTVVPGEAPGSVSSEAPGNEPGGAPSTHGNFAASTGVSLISLLSLVAVSLLF